MELMDNFWRQEITS